ncbi:hypothetical protein HanIR_Chr05g0210001 [Helianthus annuus]|nr:hypothetical protein HanIR_Chr05g0210001 [Helianthus annuus]
MRLKHLNSANIIDFVIWMMIDDNVVVAFIVIPNHGNYLINSEFTYLNFEEESGVRVTNGE